MLRSVGNNSDLVTLRAMCQQLRVGMSEAIDDWVGMSEAIDDWVGIG
jgi:hypothetical protein